MLEALIRVIRLGTACFVTLFILGSGLASGVARASAPEWSVIAYAATDEEDIASYLDPILKRIQKTPLSENIELLIENDTFGDGGVVRTIRRGNEPALREHLPEHDSASVETFARFLKWAKANATGQHKLFVVMSHSWGWKGIIQDYTVPGRADDTMMPLREFARVIEENQFHPDVLFLDSCILGTVEAIDVLRKTSRYIVASQRETPYQSFPYDVLFDELQQPISPRELARRLPRQYVEAYTRSHGPVSLSAGEGEYGVVTMAALDMRNWNAFVQAYSGLVENLKNSGFRQRLEADPRWPARLADEDSNVDLVELLKRLPELSDGKPALSRAADILRQIGYPRAESEKSSRKYFVDPGKISEFEIQLQGDDLVAPKSAFELSRKKWKEANEDLEQPASLDFGLRTLADGARIFSVSGRTPAAGMEFRPWLPGVLEVHVKYVDAEGRPHTRKIKRHSDLIAVEEFPSESFMLSEAHTQGAPFIHGLGINFEPLMNAEEERSLDPLTGLSGPAFYRSESWNRRTGWGDLIFLN